MKHRRLFGLLCAAALTLTALPAAAAGTYPDLPQEHWAYDAMERSAALGVLKGTGDGRMDPDGALSWAQFLTMLARTFAPEAYAQAADPQESWELQGYNACLAAGFLSGREETLRVSGDLAALSQPIPRRDVAVLLDRALPEEITGRRMGYVPDPAGSGEEVYRELTAADTLTDFWGLTPPQQAAVTRLYSLEIVNGRTDGAFGGGDGLCRSDGSTMLMRALSRVDRQRYGEEKTVTLQAVDVTGLPLTEPVAVEGYVGQYLSSLAFQALDSAAALYDYTQEYDSQSVSTASAAYAVTYRPLDAMELAYRDFAAAVERGEASWEDEWKQPYHRYELGRVPYKYQILFGSTEQSRYAGKADAETHMVTVTVPTWQLKSDGTKVSKDRSLAVNAAVADDVVAIFTEIYNDPEQFPIKDLGGYSWRGDSSRSEHCLGTAIDINYMENYQVREGVAETGTHWTPGADPYSIPEGSSVVRAFEKYGWSWGGDAWAGDADPATGYHDYMHFSYLGT